MIIKNFEIKNYIGKKNLFLIHGENSGLKEDVISRFLNDYSKESIFKYSEKEILGNLDEFYNNILSKSFFEDKKLIIVDDISEKIRKEIDCILEKNITDIVFIFISKTLEKKSKLRNFFEKEKDLICVPVYKDDQRVLSEIARNFFNEKKIKISSEAINLIIQRSSEDRKNLRNELHKIENFTAKKKKVDFDDLIKLTNLAENHSINKIIDYSLAKNSKQTLQALNENIFTSEDVIIIIRSFLIKSKRLLKLTEELEKNNNIDQVITMFKPPIFWKEKDIVRKQMTFWTKDKVIKLINKINSTELLLKKNTSSSLNILRNFIIEQSLETSN